MDQAYENTDKELWREGDYYSPSICVTESGEIGINVAGLVIIKPLRDWHKLATNGGWLNPRISPPDSSGRYWCLVAEQNDLGLSYYQWNCYYDVVGYMHLPPFPELLTR
jgi:hypothetical protein